MHLANLIFRPLQPVRQIDMFCLGKKFLVYNLVSRNLKIKYQRSIVGIFWTLLSPIAMGFVYYFVFKMVLNVHVPHYLAFIMSGILPWSFFSQSIVEGMESIVGNWGLISKVPMPIQVFPYVGTLTNLFTLFLSIPVLLAAAYISDVQLGPSIICLPLLFMALFLITYFLSFFLGVLFVYFRDLRHLIGIVIQIWFYATPVIYDVNMIPPKFHWVLDINPVAWVFVSIHKVMVQGAWPSSKEMGAIALWCLAFYIGTLIFHRYYAYEVVENI